MIKDHYCIAKFQLCPPKPHWWRLISQKQSIGISRDKCKHCNYTTPAKFKAHNIKETTVTGNSWQRSYWKHSSHTCILQYCVCPYKTSVWPQLYKWLHWYYFSIIIIISKRDQSHVLHKVPRKTRLKIERKNNASNTEINKTESNRKTPQPHFETNRAIKKTEKIQTSTC